MKTAFAALMIIGALITGHDARSEEYTGTCVWPSVNPQAIRVHDTPIADQPNGRTGVLAYLPYRVEIRTGRYIALWSVPATPTDASKFVGWVDQSQFEIQHPRNCN